MESDRKDEVTRRFKVPTQHLFGDKVKTMGNYNSAISFYLKQFSNVTCRSSRLIAGQRITYVPLHFNFTYSLLAGSEKKYMYTYKVCICTYVYTGICTY